jgi:hypothetical protein
MDVRELVQQLDHNYLAFYDNISYFPAWASDALCRAATGGGFSKRELYSDDDDVIYPDMKRCVGLNGINIAAQRGDLLDRSVLTSLLDIKKTEKKTDQDLLSKFEACKGEILGGFLDVLVKAIQFYPSVKTDYLFRMADFTRWGCAIAMALGKTQEDFMRAYEEKVNTQVIEAAHQSVLATVLLNRLERDKVFEGTPTALYTELLAEAKTLGISTRQKAWPKAPHALIRQLNDLAPSLVGLGWEFAETRGQERMITIQKTGSTPTPSFGEKLEQIKTWLIETKDSESTVDQNALIEKCKQVNLDFHKVVEILKDEYWIFDVPRLGKWGVK